LPVSVNVTSCDVDVPIATFPKLTFVELGERTADGVALGGLLLPPPDEPPVLGVPVKPQLAAPTNAERPAMSARWRKRKEIALRELLGLLRV